MRSPLRVLMVAPTFPPQRGGVESHTYEVSRRLAADPGFEVSVLTTDRGGQLPPHERVDGVDVERLPAWPRNADLYWSPGVARRVQAVQADIVHCQGYHTFVPILAMLAARRRRLPYVLTFHSGGHSSRLRHAGRPVQIRLLRPLLRGARRLIAVSEFEAELFRQTLGLGPKQIVVIPNGVDLPPVASADHVERDPGLILSVGRLERYKGHDRLVRALPYVRAEEPRARLLILGDGPYRRRLQEVVDRAGVSDIVEIASVPRERLGGLLQQASLVGLLSEYESQGLGVQEALALGCRILTNDSSALAELRDLPQTAVVAPDAHDRTVADAVLAQLRSAPVNGERMRLPSWDECAARLAELYRAVAGASEG